MLYIQFPRSGTGGLGFCREVTDFKSNEYHELRHLLFEYRDTAKMGHQRGVVDGIPGAHPFLSTRETTSPVAQRGTISERNIVGTFSSLFGISLLWFYFLHNFLQPVYMGLVIHLLAHTSRAVDHSNSSEWQFVMKYSGN